jgi:hypothetical protein
MLPRHGNSLPRSLTARLMAEAVVLDGEPNAADPEVSLGMGPLIEKGLQHKAA